MKLVQGFKRLSLPQTRFICEQLHKFALPYDLSQLSRNCEARSPSASNELNVLHGLPK